MNNQTLVIYDFNIMYDILKEIEKHINFKLINVTKNNIENFKLINNDNFLIISHIYLVIMLKFYADQEKAGLVLLIF